MRLQNSSFSLLVYYLHCNLWWAFNVPFLFIFFSSLYMERIDSNLGSKFIHKITWYPAHQYIIIIIHFDHKFWNFWFRFSHSIKKKKKKNSHEFYLYPDHTYFIVDQNGNTLMCMQLNVKKNMKKMFAINLIILKMTKKKKKKFDFHVHETLWISIFKIETYKSNNDAKRTTQTHRRKIKKRIILKSITF